MHQPSGQVAQTKLAFVRERRQPGFGRADRVYGRKSCAQGQLCVGELRASGDRILVEAETVLMLGLGDAIDDALGLSCGGPDSQPIWPARSHQCVCAVRLDAKIANEYRQRHAAPKLNGAAGHNNQSSKRGNQRSQ